MPEPVYVLGPICCREGGLHDQCDVERNAEG